MNSRDRSREASAALVAVGTELLGFGRMESNLDWLASRLDRAGIPTRIRAVVDDDERRIAAVVGSARQSCAIVLVTGGLGPTADDRTREGLAQALGVDLHRDAGQVARLRQRFHAFGRPFSDVQARQADLPRGCRWLPNPIGSAPGILLDDDLQLLAALPGVPAEMEGIFRESVEPLLAGRCDRAVARRILRVAGLTESEVDARSRDLYVQPGIEVTLLGGSRGVELLIRSEAEDPDEARNRLSAVEATLSERLGESLYGRDDDTLPGVVGRLLFARGWTLAVAESCTAGMLSAAVTEVPGASAWFRGGLLVYSNDLKESLADVDHDLLEREGAVSAAVARELARGARRRCGADLGIGVTGVAGPGGGTGAKPVGLVHVALAEATACREIQLRFPGDRETVRRRTVTAALDLLRRRLVEPA